MFLNPHNKCLSLSTGVIIAFFSLAIGLWWQFDHILILEHVKTQILKRGRGSLKIDGSHALIEDGEYGAHEIVGIVQFLNLFPFGFTFHDGVLNFTSLSFRDLILDASLDPLDLLVTPLISILVLLDEVLRLQDRLMGLNLDHIHIHVLARRDLLSSDNVSDINNAIIASGGLIVEEDVLRVVISLIDHKNLGTAMLASIILPARLILRDSHRAGLLKSLQVCLELLKIVSEYLSVTTVINHVDVAIIFSVRITPMWSVDLDELAEALSSAIDVNLLIWITDTHVFLVLATIEFHK